MPFNLSFRTKSVNLSNKLDKLDSKSKFIQAIDLFKNQRKKCGLSIEELSNKTKISRNVLIAIENGSQEYLPEKTYLTSMIKILEIELNLEPNSFDGLLIHSKIIKKAPKVQLNFINIDYLNNWRGNIIYIIFMLLSILILNSQQKYLLLINTLSTEPVISIEEINNTDRFKPVKK
tara:strand:+ start:2113 stop:2640 length:528 start_codon:yes stop_codon:yes gene_type:complete